MSDTILVEVDPGGPGVIVDVLVDGASTVAVDVLTTQPGPVAVDVIADAMGAVGYPQLPIELQQMPVSVPVTGRPALAGTIIVPMSFAVTVPAQLQGATVYAIHKATSDATFIVNRMSGLVTTEIGRVTFTNQSSTSCILAGTGGPLSIGDVLQFVAPVTPDATLSDLGITLMVNRV